MENELIIFEKLNIILEILLRRELSLITTSINRGSLINYNLSNLNFIFEKKFQIETTLRLLKGTKL